VVSPYTRVWSCIHHLSPGAAESLGSELLSGGWTTVLGDGFNYLDGKAGGIICVVTSTGGGLCTQQFVSSGLKCDLVQQ